MRFISSNGSLLSSLLIAGIALGCSAGTNDSSSGAGNVGGSDPAAGGAGGAIGSNNGGAVQGGSTGQFDPAGGGTVNPNCDSGADEDFDMDGVSVAQGDCNDCDANTNPGAIEVIGEAEGTGGGGGAGGGGEYVPADEDCDGVADNVPEPCDASLDLVGTDPFDGARAIELCKSAANEQDYGILSAAWVRANGVPANVNAHMGILADFGPNVLPQAGGRVLGISSGTARDALDPGYINHTTTINGPGTPPPGFPQDVPGCLGLTNINDDVGLEVSLRAPTNATGFRFDFKFYSNEFPEYVCTSFNDQFIALVNPAPEGSVNGNISFDSMNNPVSVNIAFFDVCDPGITGEPCPSGPMELQGTGFGPGEGGTTWLQTSAPVTGGQTFSIRFATWDVGDSAYDSTTIIDNFQWVANGGTVTVGTIPVPE